VVLIAQAIGNIGVVKQQLQATKSSSLWMMPCGAD
jgi:hypothetical protein